MDDEQSAIVSKALDAINVLREQFYTPGIGMTVTLHPDDVPDVTQIAGCRVRRDDAMPRGEVLAGYEVSDGARNADDV